MISLFDADPKSYVPHRLHGDDRVFRETNCYADVVIELLHASGRDPVAVLGGAVAVDFEGDQWTFFKPSAQELEQLHGVDIHEMQPYRELPAHIVEQLRSGRTVIIELDAFYLPDVAATAYRREHVKSAAAVAAIDPEAERLRYFHNASLYELDGDDFRGVLRTEPNGDGVLPPYVELVRFDRGRALVEEELRDAARLFFRRHVERLPRTNPVIAFGRSLEASIPRLLEADDAAFHAYAFATVRMAGAAFELAADHVGWLFGDSAEAARNELLELVGACKALTFRLARRRPFDAATPIEEMARTWERACDELASLADS